MHAADSAHAADLVAAVREALEGRCGVTSGSRVLVAISGGADSTALAYLLHDLAGAGCLAPTLGYVDHGWLPVEAARAVRARVRALATTLDLPLRTQGPPPEPPKRDEASARRWRYQALARWAVAEDIPFVATGHHLQDQAETLCMRLRRGTGPWGRRGIQWQRPLAGGQATVIRPLLAQPPEGLRRYLRARSVTWWEDAANCDLRYERARARRALARAGSGHIERLARHCERMANRLSRRRARVGERLAEATRHFPLHDAVRVERAPLRALSLSEFEAALRLLGDMLQADQEGPWLTRRRLLCAHELTQRAGAMDLPGGLRWRVRGKRAWLFRIDPPPRAPGLTVAQAPVCRRSWAADPRAVQVRAEVLGPAPRLRLVQPDDVFAPQGRSESRSIGVLAWLKRRGYPRWFRERQHVVVGAEGVVWVVGLRLDRGALLPDGASTARDLRVSLTR